MSRLIKHSILVIFVFLSSACQSQQSQLTKEMPNDLEIIFRSTVILRDGEPRDFFRLVTISGNQMVIDRYRCQTLEKIALEDGAIKSLYQLFVKSEFDLIKSGEAETGGTQNGFREIHLKTGNISKSVKLGEQFPLSEKDRSSFNKLWTEIYDTSARDGRLSCPDN